METLSGQDLVLLSVETMIKLADAKDIKTKLYCQEILKSIREDEAFKDYVESNGHCSKLLNLFESDVNYQQASNEVREMKK